MLKFILFSILLTIINANQQNSFQPCVRNKNTGVSESYILETVNGKVRGNCQMIVTTDASNRTRATNIYSWLSIPFAETPRRFESPKAKRSWGDYTIDGTKYPKSCYQLSDQTQADSKDLFSGFRMWVPSINYTRFSEDCLYLNVWLPTSAYRNLTLKQQQQSSSRAPIMVFVHGSSGSTALDVYNPAVFVSTTGIIVVQITYRSGLLGFFSLDGELNGNQALFDQHLALKWVYENAEHIGGDPNRITLHGISLGAMTSGLHLAYKPSWPLFRNMILQSGSPLNPGIRPLSRQMANDHNRAFLISIGCGALTAENSILVECARRLNPQFLIQESNRYYNILLQNNTSVAPIGFYLPVIDGDFIQEPFEDSLKNQNVKKCPIITGITADEGSAFLAWGGLLGTSKTDIKQKSTISLNQLTDYVHDRFAYYPQYPFKNYGSLETSVLYKYTNLSTNDETDSRVPVSLRNYFQNLNQIISHSEFHCPLIKFLHMYTDEDETQESNTYLYLYSHRISTTPWPAWYGVVHGDDLAVIFGQPISNRPYSSAISTNPWLAPKSGYGQSEKQLTQEIMIYLSNFIKFNNPNYITPTQAMSHKNWLSYKKNEVSSFSRTKDFYYLQIKESGSRVQRNFELDKCYFWNSYVPQLVQDEQNAQLSTQAIQTTTPKPQTESMLNKENLKPNSVNSNNYLNFTNYLFLILANIVFKFLYL